VFDVELSGKYPSIWTPGTPEGFCVPAACRPAQSWTFVCPLPTVPAVVRSSRQLTTCFSACGTESRSATAQCPADRGSPGGEPAAEDRAAEGLAASVAASREEVRARVVAATTPVRERGMT
jgi:hypothetical protein